MLIYRFIPDNIKQPAFIIISLIFLAVSDIAAAAGIILTALAAAGYGRISFNLKKRPVLFFLITVPAILLSVCGFVLLSIYYSWKYENAHSFLRFCPFVTAFFYIQAIRFIADIYKGKIALPLSINDSLGYLLFYPRLVMGPVMTCNEHKSMLGNGFQSLENTGEGLQLFIRGLSKKLLIADTIDMVFSPLYGTVNGEASLLMSWLTVFAFSLELYFTVACFGDMAKGIALCYGFRVPDSYKNPLLSGSLSRFGDEWNMSVVSWCKSCFSAMLRNDKWQSVIGMTAAWTVFSIWYRPELKMMIWGIWMGFWIGIDRFLKNKFKRVPSLFYGTVFFLVTFFGWAFFSADSFSEGIRLVGLLLGGSGSIAKAQDLYYLKSGGFILLIAAYGATGNFTSVIERLKRIPILSKIITFMTITVLLLIMVICFVILVTQNDIFILQWKGAM